MENRIPPRSEAVEKLENYIRENHLPANSRIPSERELCGAWGMNRTTFRQAVNEMVNHGLLYRKSGSGTYIAEKKITRNLLGVDALASNIRKEGISLSTKILSFRTLECNKQISKKLHIPLGQPVYEIIRLRAIGGLPCIIETTYLDQAKCPGFEQYDLEKSSMYSVFKNIYKMEIVDGEEKISVTYTTEEEAEILGVEEGAAIFYTTGVTLLKSGEPLEYYKALFRADRFKLVSVTKKEAQ